MTPQGEKLMLKNYHLRLDIDECEHMINALEDWILRLNDLPEENPELIQELNTTIESLYRQLRQQGVDIMR